MKDFHILLGNDKEEEISVMPAASQEMFNCFCKASSKAINPSPSALSRTTLLDVDHVMTADKISASLHAYFYTLQRDFFWPIVLLAHERSLCVSVWHAVAESDDVAQRYLLQ